MASMKEILNDLNSFEAQLRRIIELQEKVLSNHDLLQMRDAVEHPVEPTGAGLTVVDDSIDADDVRCTTCGESRWEMSANPKFMYCGNCLSAHPNNPS